MPRRSRVELPLDEIELTAIRASGPGGQKVNKVATAVQLRFDAAGSPSLPEPVRARLIELAGNRVSREGVLVITGRRFRTREANRRDVLERLRALIHRAQQVPKRRIKTRVPASARRRRIEDKRRRSARKADRRKPDLD